MKSGTVEIRRQTMRSPQKILLASAAILLSALAHGAIGAIDPVPAATLLLPYFEVDLNDSNAATTIVSVMNMSDAAVIAHLTMWTDYAVPTLAVDISLAANAAKPINLRYVLNGTGPSGEDLSEESPGLIAAHTGEQLPDNPTYCAGFNYGDNVARGYLLIDSVSATGAGFPSDPGYFVSGGLGAANNDNVLWGEYIFVDPINNYAFGEALVSIEASGTDPLTSTNGNYTFYGAFVSGTAADNREPLGSGWAAPFCALSGYGGAELLYWRDVQAAGVPVHCGARPAWYPLSLTSIAIFGDIDTSENPSVTGLFALACGSERIGTTIPTSFDLGWLDMDLNFAGSGVFGVMDQCYVLIRQSTEGRFESGHTATLLESVAGR